MSPRLPLRGTRTSKTGGAPRLPEDSILSGRRCTRPPLIPFHGPAKGVLGGAIFGDRRFGHVFVYHNTASSFYSGRAFRGWLRV